MDNHMDTNQILKGLSKVLKFVKKDFNYEYFPPYKKDNKSVLIKPDSASFSLLGSNNEIVKILSGGGVVYDENKDVTLKINLYTYANVASTYSVVTNEDVSVLSSKALFTGVKNFLLEHTKEYGKEHISSDINDNGKHYLAKKDAVDYIEYYPKVEKISNNLIKLLTKLSNKVYYNKSVVDISISTSKTINFEIFLDSDSRIVQYRSISRVSIDLAFVNDNSQFVNIEITEYLLDNDYKSFTSNLEDKIFSYLDRFKVFHNLSSGSYPVLLKSSASNVLFHEIIGAHMLSATLIVNEESTIFKGRLGEFVESLKGVDLIMDPTIKDAFGSYEYDQEGSKAEKVYLIKDGVITNYLSDGNSASRLEQDDKDKKMIKILIKIVSKDKKLLKKYVNKRFLKNRPFKDLKNQLEFLLSNYALFDLIKNIDVDDSLDWRTDHTRLKDKSNGHSRVQSWVDINDDGEAIIVSSEARMSNLVINVRNKNKKPVNEKMVELCKKHNFPFYLETEAAEGGVDVESGMAQIEPEYITMVYLDGRRKNINPGMFSMNLESVLKNISYVGSKNEINRGFCGSDSGFVPVQSGTPEVIIMNMSYAEGKSIDLATNEHIAILQHKRS